MSNGNSAAATLGIASELAAGKEISPRYLQAINAIATGRVPESAIHRHPGKGGKVFTYISHPHEREAQMTTSTLGFLWRVCWLNPYTQPPEGMPRVLAEEFVPCRPGQGAGKPPASLLALIPQPGTGYSLSVSAVTPPPKGLSGARLAKVRRERLERRMRRYPLFAAQFTREALARNPDYYTGDSLYDQARQELLDQWQKRLDDMLQRSSA
jgi:hypothetical protein